MTTFFTHPRTIFWLSIACMWILSGGSSPAEASALTKDPSLNLAKSGSDKSAFQTENVVFAVIGDYGSGEPPEADVANLVKSWNPDFIVTVGDNNYPIGAAYSIDENIGQYYHEYIYPYKGKYGSGASTKNFYPALGNHDWMSNGARPYFNYFSFHNENGYYDFVRGPLHFFIVDSDPNEPDGTTAISKQGKWLKNGLASSTSAFNVVVMHRPPYSSGMHGSTMGMQWPFNAWGADVVLSGHDHLYERIILDGFPYFVNGMGGEGIYSFEAAVPGSQVRFNQDYGAMRVEASNTSMKFQAFTRASLLVDEYTIGDRIPIVTSIVRANPDPSSASSVDFTVTFSESVSDVDASDFSLTAININGASINNVNGSGNAYTVSVNTGTGNGSLRLDLLDDDSIIGQAGDKLGDNGMSNGNFTAGESYAIDQTAPRVISMIRASPNPSNAASVDFTVTFSESVSGVDAFDFSPVSSAPSGVSVGNIMGSGNIYIVSVNTASSEDTLRLNLIDNDTILDLAGNKPGGPGIGNGNFTTGESYMIDKVGPVVSSIIRASPNPSSAFSVDFIVAFSEPVTGLDSSDFIMATNNVSGASILSINSADPFYVVTVSTGFGTGALRLDLNDDDSIADLVGNKAGGTGPGNGNFSNGEIYTIDKSAPKVLSVLRANPDPTSTAAVDLVVTFSQSVTGVDASDFNLLATNLNGASISNITGSENVYTISLDTGMGDGTLRIDLTDDDTIVNGIGIPLGDLGAGNGNFISGESYTIYKTLPRVTSIIRASPNPSGAASVDFIVTFSESVTGVDASDFSLTTIGLSNASISSVNNVDPFYIVTVNTGLGTGILRLDLTDNDSISDLAGNTPGGPGPANGNFTLGEPFNVSKISINFPPPSLRGPQRNFVTNNPTPTFSWTIVRGARAYEINIASDSNFSQIVTSQVGGGLSYTVTPPLLDGIYYWRVRAYNSDLQPGRFSYSQSFTSDTTPPPAPTLLRPADNAPVSTRPTLQWTSIGAAVMYQLEVDNNSDFSSPEFTSLKPNTSIRPSSLRKGVYFWRVRARDMAGNWSNWPTQFIFSIP